MARFEIRLTQEGKKKQWYFVLIANNYKVILISEMYKTRTAAEVGIEAVKTAVIEVVKTETPTVSNFKRFLKILKVK